MSFHRVIRLFIHLDPQLKLRLRYRIENLPGPNLQILSPKLLLGALV
jgi:hypothetical protein